MAEFFYDSQIRRFLIQFARIFSNWQVTYGKDSQGNPIYMRVPIQYGDSSRQAATIIANNSASNLPHAPMITYYISGLDYDQKRTQDPYFIEKLNVRQRYFNQETGEYENTQGDAFTVERMMPVPYTLRITVDVWTTNTNQKLEIIEQLGVLFNPSMEIQSTDNFIDWTSLSVVYQDGLTFTTRSIPVGTGNPIDILSWKFYMPIWISSAIKVKKLSIIYKIIASIFKGNAISDMQDDDLLLGTRQKITAYGYKVLLVGNTLQVLPQDAVFQPPNNDISPMNSVQVLSDAVGNTFFTKNPTNGIISLQAQAPYIVTNPTVLAITNEVIPNPSSIGGDNRVIDITNSNPAVVTTYVDHGLVSGDAVMMVGIQGMESPLGIGINGTNFGIKVLSSTNFELYNDANLSDPLDTTDWSAYVSGGTVNVGVAVVQLDNDAAYAPITFVKDSVVDFMEPISPNTSVYWPAVLNAYGNIRPGISMIALDNPYLDHEILGTIVWNPLDERLLNYTIDPDTLPQNTMDAVNSVIDPQVKFPGDGLPQPIDGQRYLLINDIGSSAQVFFDITEEAQIGSTVFKCSFKPELAPSLGPDPLTGQPRVTVTAGTHANPVFKYYPSPTYITAIDALTQELTVSIPSMNTANVGTVIETSLILNSVAWGTIVDTNGFETIAVANDIIQWDANIQRWVKVFDSTQPSPVQFATNLTTNIQYRWDGTAWMKSYEGFYTAGDWSVIL